MWVVDGVDLTMTEGDYGIAVPMTIHDVALTASDTFKITVKPGKNQTALIEKEYSEITNNTVQFSLTAAESALLKAGVTYVYSLDWYQEGSFLCNLIPAATIKVVDKA